MKLTRICVGLAVWILSMATFQQLGEFRFFLEMSLKMDSPEMVPPGGKILLMFCPVGWWAFLTPLALSVAIVAALRRSLPNHWLAGLLAGSLIVSSVLWTVSWYLGKWAINIEGMMADGRPSSPLPIPMTNLAANLALLGTSIGLAAWSVARMRKSR